MLRLGQSHLVLLPGDRFAGASIPRKKRLDAIALTGGRSFSIAVSLADPNTPYLHVTTAPSVDALHVQHYGRAVRDVTDLRTGQRLAFTQGGPIEITGVDWSGVAEFGAKVLKVVLG